MFARLIARKASWKPGVVARAPRAPRSRSRSVIQPSPIALVIEGREAGVRLEEPARAGSTPFVTLWNRSGHSS